MFEYAKYMLPAVLAGVQAACTVTAPLPGDVRLLAENEVRWFQVERSDAAGQTVSDGLLAVQGEADGLRFVLTDALGAPQARQLLTAAGWRNDGFVMPDKQARRLFGALLPLLAADGRPVYPDLGSRKENGSALFVWRQQELWRVSARDGGYEIVFPEGVRWRVRALDKDE